MRECCVRRTIWAPRDARPFATSAPIPEVPPYTHVSPERRIFTARLTVIITTLECISRSDTFVAPLKYHFNRYRTAKTGKTLTRVHPYGSDAIPSFQTVTTKWIGIVGVPLGGMGQMTLERLSRQEIDARGVAKHVTARERSQVTRRLQHSPLRK